jgi:hypothetical protein
MVLIVGVKSKHYATFRSPQARKKRVIATAIGSMPPIRESSHPRTPFPLLRRECRISRLGNPGFRP